MGLNADEIKAAYDVVVIGGGPAGSAVATLVAEKGHQVLLLEREAEARFKIGESLMAETYWSFKRLGVLDKLKASAFPRKYSVQFFSKTGKGSAPFYFFHNNPHESSTTWQVERSQFDQMLRDNAAQKGAQVRLGAAVRQVLFDGERAVGVQAQFGSGSPVDIGAKVVVDASGQSSFIARKLKLKEVEPTLKKASIFTHFKGAHRDEGVDEGATLILHTQQRDSWFWYIPLSEDRVSVGVVGDLDYLFKGRGGEAEQTFYEEVEKCAPIKQRISDAQQLFDVKTTQDFSYRSRQIAGAGWVLVGDAYGFLDPIYSSGVLLALKSGEWAADAINEGLDKGDLSGGQLGRFGPDFVAGMEAIRKLVYAFYNKEFSFAQFLRQHPQCQQGVVDILIGDVFKDGVNDIFTPMGQMCQLPESVE